MSPLPLILRHADSQGNFPKCNNEFSVGMKIYQDTDYKKGANIDTKILS